MADDSAKKDLTSISALSDQLKTDAPAESLQLDIALVPPPDVTGTPLEGDSLLAPPESFSLNPPETAGTAGGPGTGSNTNELGSVMAIPSQEQSLAAPEMSLAPPETSTPFAAPEAAPSLAVQLGAEPFAAPAEASAAGAAAEASAASSPSAPSAPAAEILDPSDAPRSPFIEVGNQLHPPPAEPLPTHLSTPDLAAAHSPAADPAAAARARATLVGPGMAPTSAGAPLGAEADLASVAVAASGSRLRDDSLETALKKPVAAASFPFSLLIIGELTPEDREKLLDLLSREQFGITEVDLEPQFASAKILIPRISEYAGIAVIQALRAAPVTFRLGPSDTIFATEETRASPEELASLDDRSTPANQSRVVSDAAHPAESIPVTADARLPGMEEFDVIDTIMATATVKAKLVESPSSAAFQEVLDGLQRELKYKAHRKGAAGIVNFSFQQMALQMTPSYRITVMGVAIRQRPLGAVAPISAARSGEEIVAEELGDLEPLVVARRAPSA